MHGRIIHEYYWNQQKIACTNEVNTLQIIEQHKKLYNFPRYIFALLQFSSNFLYIALNIGYFCISEWFGCGEATDTNSILHKIICIHKILYALFFLLLHRRAKIDWRVIERNEI